MEEEVVRLQAEIAQLQAELATALALIAQLRDQVARLTQQKTPPPPFVKANTAPAAPAPPKRRQKRRAADNKARRRATPTEIVRHAYERCPDCGYALRGGHVADRRGDPICYAGGGACVGMRANGDQQRDCYRRMVPPHSCCPQRAGDPRSG